MRVRSAAASLSLVSNSTLPLASTVRTAPKPSSTKSAFRSALLIVMPLTFTPRSSATWRVVVACFFVLAMGCPAEVQRRPPPAAPSSRWISSIL